MPDAGADNVGSSFDAGLPDAGCLNCTWLLEYTQKDLRLQSSLWAAGPGDVWFAER